MGVSKVFFKTMGFMWMKLGLGVLTTVLSILWGALLYGIGRMFQMPLEGYFVLLLIWSAGTGFLIHLINNYLGYLVKAGHVAIIATAVTTGQIPENQFGTAKKMVKERFVTSNVYFIVDKLVSRSVSQIQGTLGKVDSLLGNIPGVDSIISILQIFVKVALDYVDECCLGYTFVKKEDSAFKSAADGIVIYVQNWKVLLKNAAITTVMVIVMTFAACIIPFILFGALFTAVSWPRWIAFLLAVFVAFSVKYAFIDSFMMIKTMVSYMQVAPTTEITFDLYGKLCGWSEQFKELIGKAKEEGAQMFGNKKNNEMQPQYATNGYGTYYENQQMRQQGQPQMNGQYRAGQSQPQAYGQYGVGQGQPQTYGQYGMQQNQPQAYGQNVAGQVQPQMYRQYEAQQVQPQPYGQYNVQQNQQQMNGQYGTGQSQPQMYGQYEMQQEKPQYYR